MMSGHSFVEEFGHPHITSCKAIATKARISATNNQLAKSSRRSVVSPRIAELPLPFPEALTGAKRMFCFDLGSRYIAPHSRLTATRLRSRSFCSASPEAQSGTDMTG